MGTQAPLVCPVFVMYSKILDLLSQNIHGASKVVRIYLRFFSKAYGTRCSQAVPHPSTILARRCLTSVIRRERVCSSWYGRRQLTRKCCPCLCTSCYRKFMGTPQYFPGIDQVSWPTNSSKVQIKNIKLHIVTDIKVNFNSMLGFRISNLVGGKGTLTKQLKNFSHFLNFFSLPPHFRSRVTVSHTMLQDVQPCKKPKMTKKRPKKDQKAYGTRCSQAVPHPSTILARWCLTSVIGRERVFSSWYGRRHLCS